MPATLKPITPQEAIALAHGSMAFKGDFAQWLESQVTEDLNPLIFSAELNPVKVPAQLNLAVNGEGLQPSVRFGDSIKGVRRSDERVFRLRESSDCALVLVADNEAPGHPWRLGLSLSSNAQGQIVDLREEGDDKDQPRRRIYIWRFKVIKHCPMVGWYDPAQLARTAVAVVVSTIFGRHADFRMMEAIATGPVADPHNYTRFWKNGPDDRDIPDEGELRKDIWLDYVGDVGDGWNSTYAVARCLAQQELEIANPFDGGTCYTKRGDILVFGGDQVYPVAARKQYRERLVQPYETALCRSTSPHPHAYAIPGNHDWYDSLVSFTRLFCQKRWFGGWQTNQTRSYFALKLPGKWWLLGTDVQLDSDIDIQQVTYFKAVANKMEEGDKVIICTAEPHWIYATIYGRDDSNFNENNLAFLEKKVIGDKAKVAAFIAGDQHHYQRYEGGDYTQKITAGGGGAFLHPTHGGAIPKLIERLLHRPLGRSVQTLVGGFNLKESFPSPDDSKKLGWKNFAFLFLNPWFGLLTAIFYVLTAWAAKSDVGQYGLSDWDLVVGQAIATALRNPGALFWIAAMIGGFILFTDTHSRLYRWIAGPLHGLSHLGATFFIGWLAGYIASQFFQWEFDSWQQLLFSAAVLFALGWIVGSTIMGVYLFVSLNLFGRHSNEAFSSLAIPDYKVFLRLWIEANGNLTLFPIGISRVPRKWKRQPEGTDGPAYVPDDAKATGPTLVERPLVFKRAPDSPRKIQVTHSEERYLPKG
jgi:Calcineurin-like phosphoesterase